MKADFCGGGTGTLPAFMLGGAAAPDGVCLAATLHCQRLPPLEETNDSSLTTYKSPRFPPPSQNCSCPGELGQDQLRENGSEKAVRFAASVICSWAIFVPSPFPVLLCWKMEGLKISPNHNLLEKGAALYLPYYACPKFLAVMGSIYPRVLVHVSVCVCELSLHHQVSVATRIQPIAVNELNW